MIKIDKKTGQKLYPVSREFIQFNLISMIDEVHPQGISPNADLYWEIHDLLDTMYKYHGYLPGKLYARAKELAIGRHMNREDIHRQHLANCEE